jgi:hypothetical protein
MQLMGSSAIGEPGMSDDAGEAGASLEGIGEGQGGQGYAFGGLGMTGTPESFDTSDERTAAREWSRHGACMAVGAVRGTSESFDSIGEPRHSRMERARFVEMALKRAFD